MDFNSLQFYQIIILIISGVMIYQGVSNFLRGKGNQTLLKVGTRLIVWGGMVFIVLFPTFSNTLANIIGIEGNINAVILTGFILVFLMMFKLLSAIEHLEQQISVVTRNRALSDEGIQKTEN
ncbi:MAG: DUF2304 domain-containing protein [Candidatus Moranbacteria bacterium]|nr:DUF2304 domain-containing protein [Candidatus Moranbacteria bacterium]MDD3964952.1 DUF2304 domain-containing protein [Candidatus Moranbacteria bacterium]